MLTPHDTWHNHGNQGDEPAINLSVLDLPLAETLNSLYFEHDYTEEEEGKRIRQRDADRALPAGLFPARLRPGRLSAALRLAPPGRGRRLAHVRVPLRGRCANFSRNAATGTATATKR